ncbi:PH domain-containing protein [Prescottella agglutinans]|uniref:Membrane protein n=1 Tax=Prescottella agglutinans TaxID=1644129 RepID=A0ABT6MFD4_9NOCA|nr:PH domain-containing protein [Prescottella agglutinans]MDH6283016.1 putative membrane protein [Prescottella agglutinans]
MTVPVEQSGADALAVEEEQPWLRLDKRMLLVHPVNEVLKLLPVIAVSWIVGSRSGNHNWGLAAVAVLVVYGVLRWFTTTYRIGPVHVQLRRGVLQKKVLSIPRSRIRSVDVEARVLHRVLGLAVLRIGTGRQTARHEERFELDALDASLVPAMRAALLAGHERPAATADQVAAPDVPAGAEIGHWSPSWVRYAPFSVTGLIAIGAFVGIIFQYGLADRIAHSPTVENGFDSAERAGTLALALLGLLALIVLFVAASVLACVRYLVVYGRMTVTDNGRTVHVSHGLLRTRQTTLDRARLRGTTLKEPLLLRLAGGAALDAIMTGVSAEHRESSLLLPQSPRAEATRVMATVLGDDRQADIPLAAHGPAARRRRYTRALWPAAVAAVIAAGFAVAGRHVPWPVWTGVVVLALVGAGLAWDRYRGLGHAVLPGWLITRSGSLDRRRDAVEAAGIIGWTVRQTFFQRRAGVATVIAATPAGTGKYVVHDLPVEQAWALVEAVTPGAGGVWRRTA